MTDYGRPVTFGIFPSPDASRVDELLALSRVADREGLELVGIQDHPYQSAFADTWTLLGAVLAQTERVAVFPDVANLPLRPPAVLAKSAATLDLLSGGRFELGLGAGGFWSAIAAMGGPSRTPGEAAGALAEAIEVIRLMWSSERSVRFPGRHYQLAGVHPGPAPAHPIGIWLGVLGPRLLDLLGRVGDGWVPSSSYVAPEELAERHERIDAGAAAAGRRPDEIRRIYNVFGTITDGESRGRLDGPVRQWVDELTSYALEYGMDTFVFGAAEDDARQIRRFAAEVVPAVREQVAAHRPAVV